MCRRWAGLTVGECLHLIGGNIVLGHSIGLRVALVEPADPVHLVVDVAGDVLDVLHVGSERQRDR